MKKIIVLLSASLLLCSVCGCGRDVSVSSGRGMETSSTSAVSATDSTQPQSAADESESLPQIPAATPTEIRTDPPATVPASTTAVTHTDADDVPPALPESTAPPLTTAAPTSPETTRTPLLRKLHDSIKSGVRRKDPAFFDDAVFIGDSVTMGLRSYTNSQRNKGNACLGSAQFLCCGSMGFTNTLGQVNSGSMHPTYKGAKVTVEDGISQCGAGKALIMLGMNDFSGYGEKTWKSSVTTLLDRIEEKNPRVEIYIQSVTPIISGKEHGSFTNEKIREFNAYLQSVCTERGYTYIDVYSCMADDTGHLKKSYCGDPGAMGIHMSNDGSAAWANYLKETFC